jgi:hypothetical protein
MKKHSPIFSTSDPFHTQHKARLIEIFSALPSLPNSKEFQKLYKEHREIPHIRVVQRKGGIIKFYSLLGLAYTDQRTGELRAQVTLLGNHRAYANQNQLYKELVKKFKEQNVHQQSPYPTDTPTLKRADFRVYTRSRNFSVDVFYPSDMDSLRGCVGIKLKSLATIELKKDHIVYFVVMNEEGINRWSINEYLKKRHSPLPPYVKLLLYSEFIRDIIKA